MHNIAPSHGVLLFLTNTHKQIYFSKRVVCYPHPVFSEFLRLLACLIEEGGEEVAAQHETEKFTPFYQYKYKYTCSFSYVS